MARFHRVLQRGRSRETGRVALLEGLERRMLFCAPATWVVTTRNDVVADDGVLSLREAINMSASGDRIKFAGSLRGTIVLQNGELSIINKDLCINGPGAERLTISGNDTSRVFYISGGVVSLKGLTIADGRPSDYRSAYGGGIRNDSGSVSLASCTVTGSWARCGGGIASLDGSLTLANCTISNNSTSGEESGGGIYIKGGTATMTNCRFSSNSASFGGGSGGGISSSAGTNLTLTNCIFDRNGGTACGGIASGGSLNATGCTFSNNGADWGAGVGNFGTATLRYCTISGNSGERSAGVVNSGTINLIGCTISGNSTYDYGGAGLSNSGTATLTNCTLSGNVDNSGSGGAAIRNGGSGKLTLNNCTVSGNAAKPEDSPRVVSGGICSDSGATVILRNTIVSGNTGSSGANDIAGTVDPSSSHNLVGIGGGLTNGVNGNIVGVTDPRLGPLQNNGGPTWTMALLSGSLAINAGDNSLIPAGISHDQRGLGYTRIRGGIVDIGAYELQKVFWSPSRAR